MRLTKAQKASISEHAFERAEFYFILAEKTPDVREALLWYETSWEWLFVWATGEHLS